MRVTDGGCQTASSGPRSKEIGGRRAALTACAAIMLWPALGIVPALAEETEAELQMIAVSMPAGVLDGGPGPDPQLYGAEPRLQTAGGEDKPIAADGKPIKGPLAPAAPDDDFAVLPVLAVDDRGLLVGSQARKDADLLRDPSLSADHGAPDVRLSPAGPSGGRSR